ncbi:hypothetical protein DPMN_051091 [Dreissena polymorpha]|uniref:Uncharacterized protein n=1 Tax=Dreissena polymorpha TaxID=45954 RepID=A0A9D4CJB8_DREPO|nr:hypothetical protein DPMN_051091 [Dreissena polymorpha]
MGRVTCDQRYSIQGYAFAQCGQELPSPLMGQRNLASLHGGQGSSRPDLAI